MTKDTMRALEIIRPIADELRIKVDADDTNMYVNDPYLGRKSIGITYNSTYATLKEFIGVLILRYDGDRNLRLTPEQQKIIGRYWHDVDVQSEGALEGKNGRVSCDSCILDGTDACTRGAERVDNDEICDFYEEGR